MSIRQAWTRHRPIPQKSSQNYSIRCRWTPEQIPLVILAGEGH